MTSAISHPETAHHATDWSALRSQAPETAADALRALLRDMDTSEKRIFAARGMAALLIEERELYQFVMDEEVGDYYRSMDRFLKQEFPNSWGDIRAALRTVKELKSVPFEDLLQIKRANLEQMKKVSTGVRLLPEVVKAAKTLPEREFVSTVNQRYDQHLEVKQPVVMAAQAVSQKIDEAVEMAIALYGCKSRGEALEAVCEDFVLAHQDMIGQEEPA